MKLWEQNMWPRGITIMKLGWRESALISFGLQFTRSLKENIWSYTIESCWTVFCFVFIIIWEIQACQQISVSKKTVAE